MWKGTGQAWVAIYLRLLTLIVANNTYIYAWPGCILNFLESHEIAMNGSIEVTLKFGRLTERNLSLCVSTSKLENTTLLQKGIRTTHGSYVHF